MTDWLMKPRIFGLVLLFPTVIILTIALILDPDPSGIGTHQQLGLHPCSFWLWFEIPCPVCGMTTTFTHMAHFQFEKGIWNQPFGAVLFLGMMMVLSVSVIDIVTGKGFSQRIFQWLLLRETFFIRAVIVGLLFGWVYKICLVGSFPW